MECTAASVNRVQTRFEIWVSPYKSYECQNDNPWALTYVCSRMNQTIGGYHACKKASFDAVAAAEQGTNHHAIAVVVLRTAQPWQQMYYPTALGSSQLDSLFIINFNISLSS